MVYWRRSVGMLGGALPIKPSSIALNSVTGEWEFRAHGTPKMVRTNTTAGTTSTSTTTASRSSSCNRSGDKALTSPVGTYRLAADGAPAEGEARSGAAWALATQLTVRLVQQSPSLIAGLAFPFPRADWASYQCGFDRTLQHHDFKMLFTSKGERIPAMLYR